MTAQYPGDINPKPVLCWSTERLCSTAGLVPIVVQKINGTTFSAPFTDDHLPAGYATFLSGEPYGSVITVTNQTPNGLGHWTTGGGVIPPRMRPDIKIGPSPCLVFQGGTDNGNVWGLDITPGLHTLPVPISPSNYTVMAVLRPTTSIYRNQQSTPGLGGPGTILSLDAVIPFGVQGKTTAGSNLIENVSPVFTIAPGYRIDGPAFPNGAQVLTVTMTGPDTANLTTFGSVASFSFNPVLLIYSNPVVQLYQSGDASPGSYAITDCGAFGGDKTMQPTEFSGCEIQPVVVAWTSNTIFPINTSLGQQVYMNEIVRSGPGITMRADPIIGGYVGRMAGSQSGIGQSRCGDFWLAALLVWNQPLTQAQRAIVADSLYRRFAIPELRSIRTTKNVMIVGDSITADYTTFANYGWSKRLADKFATGVRFLNYAVPGSQVTTSPTTPAYGPTEGLFGLSVARNMAYSKAGKNVLIILAGGNDMVDQQTYTYTIDTVSNVVSVFRDATTSASAATGTKILTFSSLPRWLSVGALVEDRTTPASIPAGTTITALTATTATLSANIAAPGVGNGDTIRFRQHNMQTNMRLQFATLPLDGVGNPLVTGIAIGLVYYVKTVTAVDKFTVSATPGGAVIDINGSFVGEHTLLEYTKNAAGIFGTPTTGGLQKIVADANAAGASRVYMLTVLKRTGPAYDFIREELNALIMGGGAGGYVALDCDTDPTLANNDTPPNTAGPAYPDGTHLNELGSDALANFVYAPLNTYLSS